MMMKMTNNKSQAMIIMVFTMMVLAILGALASLQSIDFESSKSQMQSTRAFYLADAGIQHALRKLADDNAWRTTGETYTLNFGQYTLKSEDGIGGQIILTSTGYMPSTANVEAKRIVKVTVLAASWTNSVNGSALFDWSEMHSGSRIEGDIQAANYDRDNDATYNEVGVDYANPPSALPPPSTGFNRSVGSASVPAIDMSYYKTKAQETGRYIAADYLYLANGDTDTGLTRYSASTPSNPGSPSTYNSPGFAYDVHGYFLKSSNYYTCVADGASGLRVVRVDSTPPASGGSRDTSGTAYGVFTKVGDGYSATRAYVADGTYGLRIMNINTLSSITEVGFYDPDNETSYGVYVREKYAYVATGLAGLRIIDVTTNESSPALTGSYNTAGTSYGVYVRGKYAYVADGTNGLVILDVVNPAVPTLRATVDTPGTAYSVYIKGLYAYVADGTFGLQVIDVSNLSNSNFTPSIVGTVDTTDARDIQVAGNYAYIADNSGGLRTIDVTTPTSPTLVDTDSASVASGVFVLGDKTFAGGNNYNNQKVWYTQGNMRIDLTSGNSNFLKTSLVAEGDVEIIGTGALVMRAHVAESANENFPNIATENGSLISADTPSGFTESQKRDRRDFDGLLYSKNAIVEFNYIKGIAIIASYVFLDGYCTIEWEDDYIEIPMVGFVSGVSVLRWQEEY